MNRRGTAALALWCLLSVLVCALASAAARADVLEFTHMQRLDSDAATPPGSGDWRDAPLPDAQAAGGNPQPAWYRASFDVGDDGTRSTWAVYLPFLYEGAQVWVNGRFAGHVPESTPGVRVRWERPHLIVLPPSLLQAHGNQLALRAAATASGGVRHFPRLAVGPLAELQPRADRRTFWVRTMPQVTVVVCLLVAGFVLFIYWRRRSEELYGLFGLASALWGVRTLTFVIERMPSDSWQLWRITYLAATGGFIVVLALFSLRFAGFHRPVLERMLVAYWLAGPLWLWLAGGKLEVLVNQLWSAGLIPIGLSILGLSFWSLLRQRTVAAAVMPVTLMIAVLAGVHDYLIAWDAGALSRWWPQWAGQRIFLLHYGADLVLLGMGGLLTARFIEALSSLQAANRELADLNETLEQRVAERERHLAANFEAMGALQREHAAEQERQLIMREIHDGLGSRLFTSLLRVERGDMSDTQIADALRDCIADMRLALEVLAPDDDFQAALGNFLFRWQTLMLEARVQPAWAIDVPDSALQLSRQAALQLLRVAQEALTNVLKHARAKNVRIELRQRGPMLELEVADDGVGHARPEQGAGRGIGNMRARARQLGGDLDLRSGAGGTRVLLRLPVPGLAEAAVHPQ
ncbi:hypothetical protein RD110_08875 [Rhodoferax koreense]|uniref:Histidine kinase domain-containing protein n=1 Tax=Rhodoferax koreensis TaxID=1842727 RepID=A0A1P8JU64_9BURK|nr:ATP-binding protein [Rhodoferax koreense]APW37292.1 hypothetical protein RD110_08875 [Rhodoferax koreense]